MSKFIRGFAAAALLLALPLSVNAQDQQEEGMPQQQEVCEATVAPVHSGGIVAATAIFTSPFGEIVAIEAPQESGLALASEEERTQMAAEQSEELAQLANEPNASIFWLDAREATTGTYAVTLKNAEGANCVAEVTVEEPAGR